VDVLLHVDVVRWAQAVLPVRTITAAAIAHGHRIFFWILVVPTITPDSPARSFMTLPTTMAATSGQAVLDIPRSTA